MISIWILFVLLIKNQYKYNQLKRVKIMNLKEFEYTRGGNPTRKVTETCIAALENGKFC